MPNTGLISAEITFKIKMDSKQNYKLLWTQFYEIKICFVSRLNINANRRLCYATFNYVLAGELIVITYGFMILLVFTLFSLYKCKN